MKFSAHTHTHTNTRTGTAIATPGGFLRMATVVEMDTPPLTPKSTRFIDNDNNNETVSLQDSKIVQFYKDKSVFLTGATGFLGKAIIEKLLRTTDVKAIYVLIRPKPSKNSPKSDRLDELLGSPIFDGIRSQNSATLSKIIAIAGDVSAPELGISATDQERLCSEVNIVIHAAATIKFDEHLKLAMAVNVQGTERVLELAKRMPQLACVVHVSTAYANCDRLEIDEIIYPPADGTDTHKLIQGVQCFSDEIIGAMTPRLIGDKPNTYAFTKALAEQLVHEECCSGRLTAPVCIVRPSIVSGAWREPVPGWVDNLAGPTGIFTAAGTGLLRTLYAHAEKNIDLVPVDLVINLIIAAAWRTATASTSTTGPSNSCRVYNCCTSNENPIGVRNMRIWLNSAWRRNPSSQMLWYPNLAVTSSRTWHNLSDFLFHWLPAQLQDLIASAAGKKATGVKIYGKLRNATTALEFFRTHQWKFGTSNTNGLRAAMGSVDQALFNVDFNDIDWAAYIETYCLGIRKYILKQDPGTLPAARKQARVMYWVQIGMEALLVLCILFLALWPFLNLYLI